MNLMRRILNTPLGRAFTFATSLGLFEGCAGSFETRIYNEDNNLSGNKTEVEAGTPYPINISKSEDMFFGRKDMNWEISYSNGTSEYISDYGSDSKVDFVSYLNKNGVEIKYIYLNRTKNVSESEVNTPYPISLDRAEYTIRDRNFADWEVFYSDGTSMLMMDYDRDGKINHVIYFDNDRITITKEIEILRK